MLRSLAFSQMSDYWNPFMKAYLGCAILLAFLASPVLAADILKIDFGTLESSNPTPLQPGFTSMQLSQGDRSVTVGAVSFGVDLNLGWYALTNYQPTLNTGPYGALLSDYLFLPDPFWGYDNAADDIDYRISGLTPGVSYDVEFYKPVDNLFRGSVQGSRDGAPFSTGLEFFDTSSFVIQIEPNAAGEIRGNVYQATNTATVWSGISVRLSVPEPGTFALAGLALAGVATRRR